MNTANGENNFKRPRVSGKTQHGDTAKNVADAKKTETRGFLKLKNAVEAFGYDFRGKTVLDIGSSTGGFTKLALSRGATKVIAVEKGTNQMEIPLRFDPRVDLHEKTDIFEFQDHSADTIVADVSFLSLKKILAYAKTHLSTKNTDFLVMLKPQFEANPRDLNRGVVKNESIRRQIIKDFEFWLKQNGFLVVKKHDNELLGKSGNHERFYYLKISK